MLTPTTRRILVAVVAVTTTSSAAAAATVWAWKKFQAWRSKQREGAMT